MARARHEKTFLDLLKALEEHPEWREHLRQMLLSRELLELPQRFAEFLEVQRAILQEIESIKEENQKIWQEIAEIKEDIRELKEENQKIWQEIAAIKEENHRIWEEIAAIKEDIRELKEENHRIWEEIVTIKEDIRELKEENQKIWQEIAEIKITLRDEVLPTLQDLQEWKRGEEGRRRGERYEQRMIRSAPVLFAGGEGGSPEHPEVQRRLLDLLGDRITRITDPVDNVFLADLVWWKGGRVLLVEISLRVNGKDVERASRRARILQEAGVNALGVVVGDSWVGDAKEKAQELAVAWYVGGEFSPELLELRRNR